MIRTPRALLTATLLLPALTIAPAPATAQSGEPVTVSGVVVDAASGLPLPGASILLQGKRVTYSKEGGRFTVHRAPAGQAAVLVSLLGYEDLASIVEVEPGVELRLALTTSPLLMEGIEVVADRFRRRRDAVATAVRAIERRDLATSAAPNALALVQQRAGLSTTRCGNELRFMASTCAWVRGQLTPVRVTIDDAPVVGGLDYLQMYRPQELYLVEVFSGGRHVRIYTTWYAELVSKGKVRPMPILTF